MRSSSASRDQSAQQGHEYYEEKDDADRRWHGGESGSIGLQDWLGDYEIDLNKEESDNDRRERFEAMSNNRDEANSSSSSCSTEQTKGPFIITAAEEPRFPPAEHYTEQERAEEERRAAEERAEAGRAAAECLIADAFARMDKVHERVISRRRLLGPQKPLGFFGLEETSPERQLSFGLAWDRLCGTSRDERIAKGDGSSRRRVDGFDGDCAQVPGEGRLLRTAMRPPESATLGARDILCSNV